MRSLNTPSRNYICLDLARGAAALIVVSGHVTGLLFDPINHDTGVLWKAFYRFVSLGHQAVMVFFVLSGYLIGKHVWQAFDAGRWSWREYAIKRLTRLWIVLIPALILSALWGQIGMHVLHGAVYYAPRAKEAFSPVTFAGNVLFLQDIVVPEFGFDDPLWSLAYEFWYYVIFALMVFACRAKTSFHWRALSGGAAIFLCAILPATIILYGIVWLFGFAIALLEQYIGHRKSAGGSKLLTASIVLFCVALFLQPRYVPQWAAPELDFILGASFAFLLYFLTQIDIRSRMLRWLANTSSRFSYTLYVTHVPFMTFLLSVLINSRHLEKSASAIATWIFVYSATVLFAFFIYILFEKHTKHVQNCLLRLSSSRTENATF